MIKKALGVAIVVGLANAALLAGSAHAVSLNPRGTGQVLLYPYYTVNGGNQTLLSVVNTTDLGKALKVIWREGQNGREVLSLNVYLGPYDTWAAAVFSLSDSGPANLASTDSSCTAPLLTTSLALPQLPNNGPRYVAFRNFSYSGAFNLTDSGPTGLQRTREGSLEVIEMGTLVRDSVSVRAATAGFSGVPANCPALAEAWNPGGYWTLDSLRDIGPPTGGLFGAAAIVDVANGTMIATAADAIDGFRTAPLHTYFNIRPSLGDALTDAGNDIATAFVPVGATVVRSDYRASTRGIDAVSAVLMAESICNEFNVETAIGAQTEWVVTFPTKRYYTDRALLAGGVAPFTSTFGVGGVPQFGARACEGVELLSYNRSGKEALANFIIGVPPPDFYPIMCYHAQVLRAEAYGIQYSASSEILGSTLLRREFSGGGYQSHPSGYLRMNFVDTPTTYYGQVEDHAMRPSLDGDVYHGLPVQGFAAMNFINDHALPGLLANYAAASPHRSSVSCTNAAGPCS